LIAELPVSFRCKGDALQGIIAAPESLPRYGVLVVVGGPQYRAGSHRQFTLLCRSLAERGIPSLRFDHRGMGDSEGQPREFHEISDDIGAAVDEFFRRIPRLRKVAIWGLCDAVPAALLYAKNDPRIGGMILANPWVRTPQSEAATYLRHYYRERLFDSRFWQDVFVGKVNLTASLSSLVRMLFRLRVPYTPYTKDKSQGCDGSNSPIGNRMAEALNAFQGDVLFILSGNDLVAKEFLDLCDGSKQWRALLSMQRISRQTVADANHTFSARQWRDQVADWTASWVLARAAKLEDIQ